VPTKDETLIRFLRGCHLLSALSREVLEKGYLRRAGARGASFVQINLLKFMDQPGSRSVGDVMRFMGASFAAASKAVGRLKRKGWVRTGQHPGDLRAQIVAVTASGRSMVQKYERLKFERVSKLLAGLRPAQVQHYIQALEQIGSLLIRDKELPGDLCMQCGAYYSDRCLVPDRRCRVRAPN
jgi:DNA-binding MarR family transcriptional regulator